VQRPADRGARHRGGLEEFLQPGGRCGQFAAAQPFHHDYRDALRQLLVYREEPDVEEMILKLEASLYGKEAEPIDHKTLKQLLRRYHK
jgi:hypothetical protein